MSGPVDRVFEWSRTIHGVGTARHEWCMEVARAILAGRAVPEPPGRWMPGTAERRVETIRRLIGGEVE